jgi:hypothetical protein
MLGKAKRQTDMDSIHHHTLRRKREEEREEE